MSIDHVSAVLALGPEVAGTNRMVLLVLAEAANSETNECWPGRPTIADRAGLKQLKYVDKASAALEEMGLIKVKVNGCPDERIPLNKRSNLYTVDLAVLVNFGGVHRAPPSDDDGRDAPARGGATRSGEGARRAPQTVSEPETEPELPLVGDADASSTVDGDNVEVVDEHAATVDALCELLATKVGEFQGSRPPITAKWRKDMDLLIRRGPLHVDPPEPATPDRITASINAVFADLATPEGKGRFCWAANIRSPYALRDHWVQMREAHRRLNTAQLGRAGQRIQRAGREALFLEALGNPDAGGEPQHLPLASGDD